MTKKTKIKRCIVCKKFFSVLGHYGHRRKSCSERCRLDRKCHKQKERLIIRKDKRLKAKRIRVLWQTSSRGKFMNRTYLKRKFEVMTQEEIQAFKEKRKKYNTERQRKLREKKKMQYRQQAEVFIYNEFKNNRKILLNEVAHIVFGFTTARKIMEEMESKKIAKLVSKDTWQSGELFHHYLKQNQGKTYAYSRSSD